MDRLRDVSVSEVLLLLSPLYRTEFHTAIECSPLPAITNGVITYTIDNTPNYELDSVATYACDPGFVLDLSLGGSQLRSCVDDNGLDAIGVFDRQAPICVRKSLLVEIYNANEQLPSELFDLVNFLSFNLPHAGIICQPLFPHPYGTITYHHETPPFSYGTRATYSVSCPPELERRGGDDERTCTANGNSAVGVWSRAAPICAGLKSKLCV